jgi:hypothetical protein
MSLTAFPYGVSSFGVPIIGDAPLIPYGGNVWFVDGTNGSDGNNGKSLKSPVATVQKAVDLAAAGDAIYVMPKDMGVDGEPGSYAETIIIPATKDRLTIMGVSHGRTQCGLPQIKKGSGSTALLTIRAQGCLIANLGINGASATGGGILLDDDGSTKSAAGTTIIGCHFKNCKGSTATDAATGGAIQWASTGGAWQVLIKGNRFYKNVGDIVLIGTSASVPQDVVIEDNIFSGPAANVDCHLYLAGGSGMNGVIIRNNDFPCFPAIAAGSNVKNLALTGCIGSLVGNTFGTTGKTFGAAGNNLVPATVFMSDNYQEPAAGASGEVGRT